MPAPRTPRPPRPRPAAKQAAPKSAPKPADEAPPRPTELSGDTQTKIEQFLTGSLGLGAAGVGDNYAAALIAQRVPLIAESWSDLARQSPQVRAFLESLMKGGAWGGAIFSTLALVLPMGVHFGIVPLLKIDPFAPILNPKGDAAHATDAVILPVHIPRGRQDTQTWAWQGRGPIAAPAAPTVPAPAAPNQPPATGPETPWNPPTDTTVTTPIPAHPIPIMMQPPPPPAHPSIVAPPAAPSAPGPAAVSVLTPETAGPVVTPSAGPQLPGMNSPAMEGAGYSAPIGPGGVPGAVTVASVLAQHNGQ